MERTRSSINSVVVLEGAVLYETPNYIINPPTPTTTPNINIVTTSIAQCPHPSLINSAHDIVTHTPTTSNSHGLGIYGVTKRDALITTNPISNTRLSPLSQRLHEHDHEVDNQIMNNGTTTTTFPHIVSDVDVVCTPFVSQHNDICVRGHLLRNHGHHDLESVINCENILSTSHAQTSSTTTSLRPPPYPHDKINIIVSSATSTQATNVISSTPLRKGTPSYRQTHINSERQRRKAMSNLFTTLYSLIPFQNVLKPDRCTIVNYVINYVEHLQEKINDLAKVKSTLELEVESRQKYASITYRSEAISRRDKNIHKVNRNEGHDHLKRKECRSGIQLPINASVRYWGTMDIFITLSCPKRRGVWSDVLGLLEETFALDVQSATFSSTSDVCLHSIYAKVIHVDKKLSIEELQIAIMDFLHMHFK